MYQKPKGTRDILPDISCRWQKMEQNARDFAGKFGYREIRTPIFEETSLFLRSVGESSDVVSKEMYTFEDKGGRSLTLRPEGTAGVVRAFVENGLFNETLPLKVFYIGNNFRYENPQAGRYREHTQFGCECFGVDTPLGDIELIELARSFITSLGVKDFKLHINSIGCPHCRARFNKALKEFAFNNKQQFCEDCNRRMETNPLRMLDCKVEKCQKILNAAPKLKDYFCEDCRNHFNEVIRLLNEYKIDYVLDENLVRGFDYYTKTVFEFVCNNIDGNGKTLSIGGGGRYDNLVEEIGGKKVSCVGFGLGLDRIIMLMPEIEKTGVDVYVMNVGRVTPTQIYPIARKLRENGIKVECNLISRSFKSNFKFAEKLNAKYLCIIGDEEVNTKKYTLKNYKTQEEQKLDIEDIINYLKGE